MKTHAEHESLSNRTFSRVKPEPTQECTWKQKPRSEGGSTWKQWQNSESSHSTCYWKQRAATYKSEQESGTGQSPMHLYMGKVSLNLQKKLGITEGSSVKELGPIVTNILIRGSFMPDSMRAAIHLGQNNTENVAVFKNVHVEEITDLFRTTKILVLEHSEEFLDVKVIDSNDPSWKKTKNISYTGDQVDKGKSPRTLRHGLTSLRIVCTPRCSRKVERAADGLSDNCVQSRILRNRRRSN